MSELVVADLCQLSRENGEYTKESKKVVRPGVKISKDMIEEFNADYKTSGKLYVIDKEATKKNKAQRKANQAAKAERAAKMAVDPLALIDSLTAKKGAKAPEIEEEEEDEEEEIEEGTKGRKTERPE